MFGVDRRTVKETKPVGVRGRVEKGAEDTCEGEHMPTRHERHQRPAVCNGTREVATPLHLFFFLCFIWELCESVCVRPRL